MKALIDAAFSRSRVVLLIFAMILLAGSVSYLAIPKEAEPDVPIPYMHVSMSHDGISPEDAERLLLKPMEKELQALEGLKEMTSMAGEGYASLTLEFDAGFNVENALQNVREKVDIAKSELPPDTNEPRVTEMNVALFPVLAVALSGNVPERSLLTIARGLQDKLEAMPGVLKVDIGGDREEVMEIVIDPSTLENYNISFQDIAFLLQNNNQLVAAGALDTSAGRMVLKVPGMIEDAEDIMTLPVKVVDGTVVTFRDVASVRRTYKDPTGFARINGEQAIVLEISKRLGSNIIETIAQARELIEASRTSWPASIKVTYLQDKSIQIRDMLTDLQNNVLSAVILVMIVIIAALGLRPAILVGMAIPGSFLAGILVLYGIGYTLNIVILFSLILVVGMLVDGAIVTIELADRKMAEGMERKLAYAYASSRMAWPIIASIATTMAVFVPLVFWTGLVGEFMKYLPITVLITLLASLFMALVFIPVLGGMFGRHDGDTNSLAAIRAAEEGELVIIKGLTGFYLRGLQTSLQHPGKILAGAIVFLIMTYLAFAVFGEGIEFFPSVEPEFIQVQVQARGDLSIDEKDALVRKVENRLLDLPVLRAVYARTFNNSQGQQNMTEDTIGIIQLEFINWQLRPTASEIIVNVRQRMQDIPGVLIQVLKQETGLTSGKPIQLDLSSASYDLLLPTVVEVRRLMDALGGFVDVEDSRSLPSIEWRLEVNREEAARYGADVSILGSAVQMVANGLKLAEYQPDDADQELDIRLRFPFDERNLEQLRHLRIPTSSGHVPITNFISFHTAPKTGVINRVDGKRAFSIKAGVAEGVSVDRQTRQLKEALAAAGLDTAVNITFKGQDEDQRETGQFLSRAFLVAIFLMVVILLLQFNDFYQTGLILSANIFSTAGILLGLLVTGQSFGIVMCGIGVIALAGIVVNNNIILIDTYNDLKAKGLLPMDAIMRTAAQRMRPVFLTSFTTILGLMPMVLSMNIDLFNRSVTFGAPSTQWWTQLSSAIAGGLAFATVLTLVLTPCLLILGENISQKRLQKSGQPSIGKAGEALS